MTSSWAESSYIVRSETNPEFPSVVTYCKARYSVKCNCPRYKYHALCKHALSVALTEIFLEHFIHTWVPSLAKQIEPTVPDKAGQKKNDKGQRKQTPVHHRNIQDYRQFM